MDFDGDIEGFIPPGGSVKIIVKSHPVLNEKIKN